ncbi:unnamed protein product [Ceratitis capitata]|uniref:(Mediterranean fruit fly) hypothetical protein n=1 Tax=Ceratitis capitata TaxID=7213 RepID=A0A811UWK9_CERCA|nr:unnamed protein product [Ceratitis capitata]
MRDIIAELSVLFEKALSSRLKSGTNMASQTTPQLNRVVKSANSTILFNKGTQTRDHPEESISQKRTSLANKQGAKVIRKPQPQDVEKPKQSSGRTTPEPVQERFEKTPSGDKTKTFATGQVYNLGSWTKVVARKRNNKSVKAVKPDAVILKKADNCSYADLAKA